MRREEFTEEEARSVGEQIGVDWSAFDVDQFRRGMDVELEHGTRDSETNVTGDDALATGKIAWAHLKEIRDYYDRLEKLEQEGKKLKSKNSKVKTTTQNLNACL